MIIIKRVVIYWPGHEGILRELFPHSNYTGLKTIYTKQCAHYQKSDHLPTNQS